MANSVPPNWYPDPSRRFELRYWDGAQWSDHVVSQRRTYVDPLIPGSAPTAAHMPKTRGYDAKIGRQVRKAKVEGPNLRRGGTLLTESVLVINQKPKRHEFLVEYEVFSREGGKLGEIRETGFGFVLPALTGKSDEERKRKLEVVDSSGTVLYRLKQTVTSIRSRVTLSYPDGKKVGKFIQKGLINRKLILQGRSSDVGHVAIEDWHNFRATVFDASKQEVASITRTWAGRRAEARTRADNYVLEIKRAVLDDPLRGFVIAAPVAIDLLHQQDEPSKEDARREREDRRHHGV